VRIKTDDGPTTILSQKNEHNHSLDERKVERHQLRVSAKRKAIDDLSQRPSKIVRTSIKDVGESVLLPNDLKSVSKAIYRVR
jgi:transcription initiation factor TFIIIB Brf1 subunit/transcription initiation factor TFIIB